MSDPVDYRAMADTLGLEFQEYANRLGIRILPDGEPDLKVSRFDRPLTYAIEYKAAYISMSIRGFDTLKTAARDARDRAKKFLDENHKNIVSLRSVRGAVLDDPFGGCIKFCVTFVGTIRQFSEDGTMNTLGA